jgi:hypothetical protein
MLMYDIFITQRVGYYKTFKFCYCYHVVFINQCLNLLSVRMKVPKHIAVKEVECIMYWKLCSHCKLYRHWFKLLFVNSCIFSDNFNRSSHTVLGMKMQCGLILGRRYYRMNCDSVFWRFHMLRLWPKLRTLQAGWTTTLPSTYSDCTATRAPILVSINGLLRLINCDKLQLHR